MLTNADYKGPPSPFGHIPLSFKIFLLTPLVPVGMWIAIWGAKRFSGWRNPLPGIGMLLLGCSIAGLALSAVLL
jgi:hypothetical protein